MNITIANSKIYMSVPFEHRELVKDGFERPRWDKRHKVWVVTNTVNNREIADNIYKKIVSN